MSTTIPLPFFFSHGVVHARIGHRPIRPPVGLLSGGAPAKVSFRPQSNAHRHAAHVVSSESITPVKEVSSFEPSVWGDFFINYDPKPLQVYIFFFIFILYTFCSTAELYNCSVEEYHLVF